MNVSYLFSDQNPTEVTDTEEPENPLNENISDVESTASELGRRIRILGLVNSLGWASSGDYCRVGLGPVLSLFWPSFLVSPYSMFRGMGILGGS